MSVDRLLAKTLRLGRRLNDALFGGQSDSRSSDDGPMSTLRSLLEQSPDAADGLSPAYKASPGPYAVDLYHQSYRDHRVGREVPITALYPLGLPSGRGFPVVVLSPGLGAHAQATRYLERHLASHGYIVLCPIHRGSDWMACFWRTPFGAFSQRELVTRVSEVGLAVELLETERLPPHLCKRADVGKVALVGHSFGALTIQAVAGVPVRDPSGREIPLYNPRFDAFIGMSPYGDAFPAQRLGMTQQGYSKIDRPILFMSGDQDDLWTVGRGPHTHLGPYRWVSTTDRYHLLIGGTKHSDFSEVLGMVKKRTATMVNSTATAFLDCYLKDDTEARQYLRTDLPVAASQYRSWAFVGGTESAKIGPESPPTGTGAGQ